MFNNTQSHKEIHSHNANFMQRFFFEQKYKISSNLQPNLGNKPGLLEKESEVLTTMLQELYKFRATQPIFTLTLFRCLYC